MTAPVLTARDLTADDLDVAFDVRTRSFGKLDPSLRDLWDAGQKAAIADRRAVGVYDGDTLVAHAKVRSFRQFWGGRPLAMGGVASVVVAPDYRGRGVGSVLMRAVTARAVELGDVLSVLYPATMPIYRRLGWESAGSQYRISIDAGALRTLGRRDVAVRRAVPGDESQVLDVLTSSYAGRRVSGPRDLGEAEVTELLTDRDQLCYLADDGFVSYCWDGSDLVVETLCALSEPTARALWATVGSGSSVAKTVHAYVAPDDPIHLLLGEQASRHVQQIRWMLRVLDARAAIAGRGFPPGLTVDVPIRVDDPLVPRCSGVWRLQVAGGRGALVDIDSDDADSKDADSKDADSKDADSKDADSDDADSKDADSDDADSDDADSKDADSNDAGDGGTSRSTGLRLGPNGLAALYGGSPVASLRVAGLATGGDPADDALLDAAFRGSPYLLDYF